MTIEEIVRQSANGNEDAYNFGVAWLSYCHKIDDIIDEKLDKTEAVRAFYLANRLYSNPFYQRYVNQLESIVAIVTINYEIANDWDETEFKPEGDSWKRAEANYLRSDGNNMIVMIALICGNYPLAKEIAMKIKELSYLTQRAEQY